MDMSRTGAEVWLPLSIVSLVCACHHNTLEVAKLLCICQWARVYNPSHHVALHKLHSKLHPEGRMDMKVAQSKNMIAIM